MATVIKRVYEPAAADDGYRVLIDRVWARGITKEKAALDEWCKDLAPSTELRKWFGHEPPKFDEFAKRYRKELEPHADIIERLRKVAHKGRLTIVYSAHDEAHNNAVVVKALVDGK